MSDPEVISGGWINRIVETFLKGSFSILLILISLLAGGFALWLTPREEDPQIIWLKRNTASSKATPSDCACETI